MTPTKTWYLIRKEGCASPRDTLLIPWVVRPTCPVVWPSPVDLSYPWCLVNSYVTFEYQIIITWPFWFCLFFMELNFTRPQNPSPTSRGRVPQKKHKQTNKQITWGALILESNLPEIPAKSTSRWLILEKVLISLSFSFLICKIGILIIGTL